MLTWTRPALGRSRPSARTPGKPPPVSRTTRGDLPRGLELAAQVDVERDQRPARADEHPACGRVSSRCGPKSGVSSPAVDPALELVRAAAPEERRPAARARARRRGRPGRPSSSPTRRASVAAAACARGMSSGSIGTSGTTSAAPIRGCAPSWRAQVDAVARARDPGEERLDELLVFADEREDGAVVVDVGVDVEQLGMLAERRREGVDRRLVASFREVRHRFERQRSRTYSRNREGVLRRARARVRRLGIRDRPFHRARPARLGRGADGLERRDRGDAARAHAGRRLRHRLAHAAPPGRDRRPRRERVDARDRPGAHPGGRVPRRRRARPALRRRVLRPLFTGHFYGHLEEDGRLRFLAEARRVARELVVDRLGPHERSAGRGGRSAS